MICKVVSHMANAINITEYPDCWYFIEEGILFIRNQKGEEVAAFNRNEWISVGMIK